MLGGGSVTIVLELGLRATVWRERGCSDGPPLSDVHVGRAIA